MLPIDSDFTLLYFLYGVFYTCFIVHLWRTTYYKKVKLFTLIVGLGFNLFLFTDPNHFKYGSALVVLFYSFSVLLLQLVMFILLYVLSKRKNKR